MKRALLTMVLLASVMASGCASPRAVVGAGRGPVIEGIAASTKSFSIDCPPTAVTVKARVTDAAGISRVQLWYRVGSDGPFVAADMAAGNGNEYAATVKGVDVGPAQYGAWEFYVTAENKAGQESRSETDASVQFLPCVAH